MRIIGSASSLALLALTACKADDVVITVEFGDQALKTCVHDALDLADGDLFPEDVADLRTLECQGAGIADLTGLEWFSSLEALSLWENQVVDLTPLAGLSSLESLQLGHNEIEDIGPLAGLDGLARLGLADNEIATVEPLASPEAPLGVEWLNLDNNRIHDAAPLADLPALAWVTLDHNALDDDDAPDGLDAEWYAMYQAARRSASRADPEVVAQGDPVDLDGVLLPEVDPSGRARFAWQTAHGTYPVIPTHPGELRVQGGHWVWERGEERLVVGRAGELPCTGRWSGSCELSVGRKAPNGPWAGEPVFTLALSTGLWELSSTGEADTDLLPYVFASPNQYDAGSCLFMANTGAMEVLLNQHLPEGEFDYLGDTDLSERFLMNAYGDLMPRDLRYFLTDVLYTYNEIGGSLLSRDYPFTAGYVEETSSGSVIKSTASDPDSYLSCYYNWFDDRYAGWHDDLIETPTVDRTRLFSDPDESQWNVGLLDHDHVERIKHELRTKDAPVVVVYNHYLYWHAALVVGYDDTVDADGCPMVESSISYFDSNGARSYARKIEDHMEDVGGCTDHGVFYVRDSIYDGELGDPVYTYNEELNVRDQYSERIIEHSYDWVRFLGNHVYSVHDRR